LRVQDETERDRQEREEKRMTLREIADLLDAKILVGGDHLDTEVKTAFAADLMSDVLAFAKPGSVMITGLTNPQIVRIASIVDNSAILVVRGKIPPPETLTLAVELDIPVLSTRYILFETSGRLYANGIVGCVRRIEGPESVVPL
jgi:predicted transcriptional regulator